MKRFSLLFSFFCITAIVLLTQCTEKSETTTETPYEVKPTFGGFESQVKWGEHLVLVLGCDDCHSPKVMTPQGPIPDTTLRLSGHPSKMPPPDVDRKAIESKGLALTNPIFTAWIGPWGISYAGNLTSDESGIGNWQESNFLTAIREGKLKGLDNGRPLLPPMPWHGYRHMSDDELKSIFAYLKSTKPVKNVVPEPVPPVMAMGK